MKCGVTAPLQSSFPWKQQKCTLRRQSTVAVQKSNAGKTGAVGIDLGTTNSVLAVSEQSAHHLRPALAPYRTRKSHYQHATQVCQGQQTIVLPTSDSTSMLPSVVSIGDEEDITVGAAAKR